MNGRSIPVIFRGTAVLLAALLALGSARPAGAAEPYEIPVIASLTGALSFIGATSVEALRAFEDTFNNAGGLDGRPIHFVIADDQTNPQVAVQLMNQIAAKNPPFILGPTSSGDCNAVFPLARSGPVVYCFSTAVAARSGTFEFQALNTNFDMNVGGMRFLRMRGWKRIALISPTDATGQTYDRGLDAILQMPEFKGMTLVAREHFNPGDVTCARPATS